MSPHDRNNLNNLYDLYRHIGKDVPGNRLYDNPDFQVVGSPQSVWPNIAFRIPEDEINDALAQAVDKTMKAAGMRPLAIAPHTASVLQTFRTGGFLPVEKWTGMYNGRLDTPSPMTSSQDAAICMIEEDDDIASWVNVVSQSLFASKHLDPRIFTTLRSAGKTELIALRVKDRLVGTSMIHWDASDKAGIYMVGIKESHRRRGLGRQLMRFCLGRIRKKGISECYLQSTRAGIALYASLGFDCLSEYLLYSKIK